jgi:Na+/glutamate symporter
VRTLAALGLVALSGGAITKAAMTPSAEDERAQHAPDRALAFAKALTNDV